MVQCPPGKWPPGMASWPLARPAGLAARVGQPPGGEETAKLLMSSAGNGGQPQDPREGRALGGLALACPTAPLSLAQAEPSKQGEWAGPGLVASGKGSGGGSTLEGPAAPCSPTRGDPWAGLMWGGDPGPVSGTSAEPGHSTAVLPPPGAAASPACRGLSARGGEGGMSAPSGFGCCRRGGSTGGAGSGAAAICRERGANPPPSALTPNPVPSGASPKGLRALPCASRRERKWRCPGRCGGRTVPVAVEPARVGE